MIQFSGPAGNRQAYKRSSMDSVVMKDKISLLREEWRRVREKRLGHRDSLLAEGISVAAVRRDSEYRLLKKKQRSLFVRIRQEERKLNRAVRGNKG